MNASCVVWCGVCESVAVMCQQTPLDVFNTYRHSEAALGVSKSGHSMLISAWINHMTWFPCQQQNPSPAHPSSSLKTRTISPSSYSAKCGHWVSNPEPFVSESQHSLNMTRLSSVSMKLTGCFLTFMLVHWEIVSEGRHPEARGQRSAAWYWQQYGCMLI